MNPITTVEGAVESVSQAPDWEAKLTSIEGADPAYGAIEYAVPPGLTPRTLTSLSVDYNASEGGLGGGSPRISLVIGEGHALVSLGTPPQFDDAATGTWQNSGNLVGSEDGRIDISSLGGSTTTGWQDLLDTAGDQPITSLWLPVDGGWKYPGAEGQVISVRNLATVPAVEVDDLEAPLLTPGANYYFRLTDSYEFEATLVRIEYVTARGRPSILVVARGEEVGFVNLANVAVAWARPGVIGTTERG